MIDSGDWLTMFLIQPDVWCQKNSFNFQTKLLQNIQLEHFKHSSKTPKGQCSRPLIWLFWAFTHAWEIKLKNFLFFLEVSCKWSGEKITKKQASLLQEVQSFFRVPVRLIVNLAWGCNSKQKTTFANSTRLTVTRDYRLIFTFSGKVCSPKISFQIFISNTRLNGFKQIISGLFW